MNQTTAGHQQKQEDDFDECEHYELDELARPRTMSMAVFARAGLAVWLEGWLRDLWWD